MGSASFSDESKADTHGLSAIGDGAEGVYFVMRRPRCASANLFRCVGEGRSMAKRRGNPNWGKPEPIGPVVPTVTSFEQVVKEYKLTPDQYIRSTRLREWARRNKNSKYIPEALLEAWGFEIESTL